MELWKQNGTQISGQLGDVRGVLVSGKAQETVAIRHFL
jgi:hypothetical protein